MMADITIFIQVLELICCYLLVHYPIKINYYDPFLQFTLHLFVCLLTYIVLFEVI